MRVTVTIIATITSRSTIGRGTVNVIVVVLVIMHASAVVTKGTSK